MKAWDWRVETEVFQQLVNEEFELNGCQQKVATVGLWLKCCKGKLGTEGLCYIWRLPTDSDWQDRLVAIEVLQLKGVGTEG